MFGLKIIISLLKLMKEIIKIMTQMMKKKEKACLKIITLKFVEFDLFKFLGEIILYISELPEENAVNGVINKITKDFKKTVTATKSKELK